MFSLNPNNNIAESFRRFGIDENTTSVLVIKVSMIPTITREFVQRHLDSIIEGTAVQFSDENIRMMTDFAKVRKVYRLADSRSKPRGKVGGQPGPNDAEKNMTEIQSAILGAMALRGAT